MRWRWRRGSCLCLCRRSSRSIAFHGNKILTGPIRVAHSDVDPEPRRADLRVRQIACGSNDSPHIFLERTIRSEASGRLHIHNAGLGVVQKAFQDARPIALGARCLDVGRVKRSKDFAPDKRQLHSVVTAAQEAGIGTAPMEQLLIAAGAIAADDPRPMARKTFNAAPYAGLLAEVPTLIGSTTLRKAMGAYQNSFDALVADGLLVPRAQGVQAAWRLRDGLDLVAEIQAYATGLEVGATGWESLQRARARSGLGLDDILGGIREGRLHVGQQYGTDGWQSFRVRKAEVDRMARPRGAPTERGMIPAGVVAREVGLHNSGHFIALLAAGHSPAQRMTHPRTGVTRLYLSIEDKAEFHRRFLTLRTMAKEFGEARGSTFLARLDAAGVQRFSPNSVNFGPIWLRAVVEAALF